MIKLLRKFIYLNQQISEKLENFLPHTKPDITNFYAHTVARYVDNHTTIVDVGAGAQTPFVKNITLELKYRLIGIDAEPEEIAQNKDLDQKIIADINQKLPLQKNSADLIVSRYTLEHLNSLENFVQSSHEILKHGGYFIHLFSAKYALFAMLNQLLPLKFSKILLQLFIKEGKEIHGFKTYYNHCYYSEIKDILNRQGFEIEHIYLSYYQARYFSFFVPLFLVVILYEIVLYHLGIKNLAAYLLIVAKKK